MKNVLVAMVMTVLSTSVFSNVVQLQSGENVSIGKTVVVCERGNSDVLNHYCLCQQEHYLYLHYLLPNGTWAYRHLGDFSDVESCERMLIAHPSCR